MGDFFSNLILNRVDPLTQCCFQLCTITHIFHFIIIITTCALAPVETRTIAFSPRMAHFIQNVHSFFMMLRKTNYNDADVIIIAYIVSRVLHKNSVKARKARNSTTHSIMEASIRRLQWWKWKVVRRCRRGAEKKTTMKGATRAFRSAC